MIHDKKNLFLNLYENDYCLIACDGKRPFERGYMEFKNHIERLNIYLNKPRFSNCNYAVLLKYNDLVCIDVDIDIESYANEIKSFILEKFKNKVVPVRSRENSPRFACIFRKKTNFKVKNTPNVLLEPQDNKKAQIDVLDRLITCYGVHESGSSYYFEQYDLQSTKTTDIDYISEAEIDDILEYSRRVCSVKKVKEIISLAIFKPNITNADIISKFLISFYGKNDFSHSLYKAWLSDSEKLTDEYLNIFNSCNFEYQQVLDDDYKNIFNLKTTNETKKSIIIDHKSHNSLVSEETSPEFSLESVLIRFYHCIKDNKVYDIEDGQVFGSFNINFLRDAYKNKTIEVTKVDVNGNSYTKRIPVFEAWVADPNKIIIHDIVYKPSRDPELLLYKKTNSTTRLYLNTYSIPKLKEYKGDDTDGLNFFLNHVRYLFNNDLEAEYFINWMCFTLQKPEIRCVTPFHVSKVEGLGRNTVALFLEAMLGEKNCSFISDIEKTIADGWGDFLYNKKLIVINELPSKSKAREQLKSLIIDDKVNLNLKGGSNNTQEVYANFLVLSNNLNGLTLDENDRRISTFFIDKPKKNFNHYSMLRELLQNKNTIKTIREYLLNKNIDKFNYTVPFENQTRQQIIDMSKDALDEAIDDFLIDFTVDTSRNVVTKIRNLLNINGDSEDYSDKHIFEKLKSLHCYTCRKKGLRHWVNRNVRYDEVDSLIKEKNGGNKYIKLV